MKLFKETFLYLVVLLLMNFFLPITSFGNDTNIPNVSSREEFSSDDYINGIAHETMKKYNLALILFKRLARQGYIESQFRTGVYYYCGYGVGKNRTEAIKWLTKASDRGHSKAKRFIENKLEDDVKCFLFLYNAESVEDLKG